MIFEIRTLYVYFIWDRKQNNKANEKKENISSNEITFQRIRIEHCMRNCIKIDIGIDHHGIETKQKYSANNDEV